MVLLDIIVNENFQTLSKPLLFGGCSAGAAPRLRRGGALGVYSGNCRLANHVHSSEAIVLKTGIGTFFSLF